MADHMGFYTDSNGLELVHASSNTFTQPGDRFYPLTSAIVNGDDTNDVWLTVLTDRALGGSCIGGRTEILLNRHLTTKDEGEVDELLDEAGPHGEGLTVAASFQVRFTKGLHRTRTWVKKITAYQLRPLRFSTAAGHPSPWGL